MSPTLLKTATYGVMHLTVAILVAYALTRNWHIALAVGIVEPIVQTFAFAIHERLWLRFGRQPMREDPCGHGSLPPRAVAEPPVKG